jgi:hypothetical protein
MDIEGQPRTEYHADTKENKVRVACIKDGVTSEATTGIPASAMK